MKPKVNSGRTRRKAFLDWGGELHLTTLLKTIS